MRIRYTLTKITVWSVMGILVVWNLIAVYGCICLYDRSDRIAFEGAQAEKIASLELTVYEYEQINKVLPELRKILTPLENLELKAAAAIAEEVRRKTLQK